MCREKLPMSWKQRLIGERRCVNSLHHSVWIRMSQHGGDQIVGGLTKMFICLVLSVKV